jgi:ribosomal peptide maturation radical SAM protein 1
MPEVCLVSMPYGGLTVPSISIGLLLAEAREAGLLAQGVYANFWFAERIGVADYAVLSDTGIPQDLTGEWTFSGAAFPGFEPDHQAFLGPRAEKLKPFFDQASDPSETLWRIRREAERFVEEAAERVLALRPRVVGCSSTFQQHCASLALLRRVKELSPDVVTMLGGANCAGTMGFATRRMFPWVDLVVSGEADHLFAPLCRRLLDCGLALVGELPPGVFGAHLVTDDGSPENDAELLASTPVTDLDRLPVPDYDDYFRELEAFSYREFVRPGLLVETSRGCWWGQKQRCTFCGLFEGALRFRSKSPVRVLSELRGLHSRHSVAKFATTDLILDMDYFETLLPRLATEEGAPYWLYCETKANLTEGQVGLLAEAGVRWIQPGIESLHDGFLRLLGKGTTALGNLALLKFALENGVWVVWNMLTGAPGAPDDWYEETASWLPLVGHLQPPASIIPIRYDRFSRYFDEPERHGLALAPHRSYAHVYPLAPHELRQLAYFFEDERERTHGGRNRGPGLTLLERRVKEWKHDHNGSRAGSGKAATLIVREGKDESVVSDQRPVAVEETVVLRGLSHLIHRACRVPRTVAALKRDIEAVGGADGGPGAVDDALRSLVARKLLLRVGDRLLTLATLPAGRQLMSMREFPAGFNYAIVCRQAAARKQSLLSLARAVEA